jgi:hypothetical protein
MFDCLLDLPCNPSLQQACRQASVSLGTDLFTGPDQPDDCGLLAARAVQRALAIALICARYLGRYHWEGTLDTGQIMAANAWDSFLSPRPRSGDSVPVTMAGTRNSLGRIPRGANDRQQ